MDQLIDFRLDASCLNTIERSLGQEEASLLKEAMRDLFIASVEDGLTRLERWSSSLPSQVLRGVKGKRVTLGCYSDTKSAGYYRWWFGHQIFVTRLEKGTRTVMDFYSVMGGELEAQPLWRDAEASPTVQSARDAARRVKHIIFHEFLHFAGFAMSGAHNDYARRESDRVYSCGALAFPSNRFTVSRRPDGADLMMTARACETCVGDDPAARLKCRAAFP